MASTVTHYPLSQTANARRHRQNSTAEILQRWGLTNYTSEGVKRFNIKHNGWEVSYWPGANRWTIRKPWNLPGQGLLPLMAILLQLYSHASSAPDDAQLIQDSWYLWLRLEFPDEWKSDAESA